MPHNEYGVIGDGTGSGKVTLEKYFPEVIFKNNVIIGAQGSLYPGNNYFPARMGEVGFAGSAAGNYELSRSSAFKERGTDGKDIGCDMNELKTTVESRRNNQNSDGV